MRILRRKRAVEDAEEIADYIAQDNLEAAIRFLDNVESTLQQLFTAPGAGSPFESTHPELANLRFRRVKGFPLHVVFYIAHEEAIEVVRILHGARDLEGELGS
jgi:toxin ParE1/3/4